MGPHHFACTQLSAFPAGAPSGGWHRHQAEQGSAENNHTVPSQLLTLGLFSDGWSAYLCLGGTGLRRAECWVMGSRCPLPLLSPVPHATSHVTSSSAAHFWFSLHRPDPVQEQN